MFRLFVLEYFFFVLGIFFFPKFVSSFPANFTTGSDTLETSKPSAQSIHTIVFTTTKIIPSDGDILITIPSVDATGQTNNGIADSGASVQANGFDLNSLTKSEITVSTSGCNNNWNIGTITEGTQSSDHKIRLDRHIDSCAAGATITVTIGNSSTKMINPAPLTTPSTDGKADIYTIHVRSRDGSDNKLDQLDVRVALVGPVIVSATVGETFAFNLTGLPAASTACGVVTNITTTSSAVPWGNITKPFTFQNAAHLISVSTNAKDGYVVTANEDDQLKRKGFTCDGSDPGPATNCIRDTMCDNNLCTENLSSNWLNPKQAGFGFSLENLEKTDGVFTFNENSYSFLARQFADQEAQESPVTLMSGLAPTTGSSANICYRISIASSQPAGFYTNHLLYTATPRF